jgi:hypothetical protein
MAVLCGWLSHFLGEDAHRFPAPGTVLGRPAPPPSFPQCWDEHAELVVQLQLLKLRPDQIEDGDTDGGYQIEDWFAFLDDRLLPL